MGMYTEFFFRGELHQKTPVEVINFLDRWFNRERIQITTPDHEFFGTDRWRSLFSGGSAYFPALPESGFSEVSRAWELGIHSNFKNYGNEIPLFLDWISPYLYASEGQFLGYSLYEESDTPTLYHFKRS